MYIYKEKILQAILVQERNLKLYKLSLILNLFTVNEGKCDKNKMRVKNFPLYTNKYIYMHLKYNVVVVMIIPLGRATQSYQMEILPVWPPVPGSWLGNTGQ